jgi:phenol hydroxylase P5 protein
MSYQVTIEPAGTIIEVEEDQTILDAALRQGVWLPFACGHGTCGTCKVQVTDGFYDVGEASPFALMDIEREENKVLLAVASLNLTWSSKRMWMKTRIS